MKNQYFGDENDYKKFGILKNVSSFISDRIAVCWMLTPDDGTGDGSNFGYLERPWEWRTCDPELFDSLKRLESGDSKRSVGMAESILGKKQVLFFDRSLKDDNVDRQEYFRTLKNEIDESALVFFNPDIGMAPAGISIGQENSNKFLFWDELHDFYTGLRQSIMVCQQFPKVTRLQFIPEVTIRFLHETNAPGIFSLRTSRVVYFIIPQQRHQESIERACVSLIRKWSKYIEVWYHPQSRRLV